MKRLTERDIQEKLYGKYHRANLPETPPPPAKSPIPEPAPKPAPEPKQTQKPPPEPKPKAPKAKKKEAVPGAPRPIPPRQASLFVASLLAVAVVILLFSLRSRSVPEKPPAVKPVPSQTAKAPLPPAFPEEKRFTIQTIVYAKRDQAELFVQDLKKKNLEAVIEEGRLGQGQPRYLVCVGDFRTASEAAQSLEKLTRLYPTLFRGGFVRKR